ncbi:MAG: hypothetical protein KDE27_16345 [Planctomycetes bacterium]|nr:hypothetical protein [Planctomycetota bacterium]
MFRRLLTRLQSASLRRVVLGDTDLNLTVTRDDDYGLFRGHARYTGSERWGLIEGQGADWDARIAELKAWSELLERCSFYMQISDGNPSQYTTNGFAAHFWRRHVRDAALAELVERDVFLCSWLLGRRALVIEPRTPTQRELDGSLRGREFDVALGVWGVCMGLTVGVTTIRSPHGFAMDAATARSTDELVEKLLVRAYSLTAPLCSEPRRVSEIAVEAYPLDHFGYWLDRGEIAESLIDLSRPAPERLPEIRGFDYDFEDLTPRNELAKASGFEVVRAHSGACQNLWFGATTDEQIRYDRLREFAGEDVDTASINRQPHPMS